MSFDFDLIRNDLDADEPRLIYADWLAEQGDTDRAEFVSLQVRLARCAPEDAERHDLHKRSTALFKKHRRDWLAPVKPLLMFSDFERGFIERARVKPKVLAAKSAEIFAAAPLLHSLWSCDPCPKSTTEALARLPELERLDALSLSEIRLGAAGLSVLLGSKHLTRLRELKLYDTRLDDAALEVLGGWASAGRLEKLRLGGNLFGDAALSRLLARTPALHTLDVSSARLGDLGRAIAQVKAPLRSVDTGWNPLGRQDVQALRSIPGLESWKHDSTGISAALVQEIAAQSWGLRELRFFQAQFDDANFERLCSGPWENLRLLKSDYNKLTEAGWKALDREWPALEELYLDHPQTAGAARALHRVAPQIKKLTFWGGPIDAALQAMLEVPWPKLHTLRFGHAKITGQSVPALNDRSILPVLRSLDLGKAGIAGADLRALRKTYGWGLER